MRAASVLILLACIACDPALVTELGLVKASDLAGTYTGVLQGVSVSNLDDVDSERHIIVDLDLLHELTIRDAGGITVSMHSSVIPPLRAIVVGRGPVALNVEFVEFEALQISNGGVAFDAVQVKQIVFVQYAGEWIVVLQLVKVQTEAEQRANGIYVYQYVSYPAHVAAQMNEAEAILYVNAILKLLSGAQRSPVP